MAAGLVGPGEPCDGLRQVRRFPAEKIAGEFKRSGLMASGMSALEMVARGGQIGDSSDSVAIGKAQSELSGWVAGSNRAGAREDLRRLRVVMHRTSVVRVNTC